MVDTQEIRGQVRTEQTRKSLKFQQLLAVCTVITGIVLLIMSSQAEVPEGGSNTLAINGFLTLAAGSIWNLIVRSLMWWHHG
jgi:hypothetical protein